MKVLRQLQKQSHDIVDDIKDVLQAASINLKALLSQYSKINNSEYINSQLLCFQQLLKNVINNFNQRPQMFISHLITKQIRDQEQKVRRERINDYQQKIYDQRRLISDKQSFFQNLLRPKKKRTNTQTPQDFQQARNRQKQLDQKHKFQTLGRQLIDFQILRKYLDDQSKFRKLKQLQNTKSSSISQINITLSDGLQSTVSARISVVDQSQPRSREPKISSHVRHSSLQNYLRRQTSPSKQTQLQYDTIVVIIQQIITLQQQNEQLSKIYAQQLNINNFKNKNIKQLKAKYDEVNSQIKIQKKISHQLKEQKAWKYNRVNQPIKQKRLTSLNKL